MLERLRIANLAVVEHAEIAFGPGLNVVTGETGAGKSLLVQSVSLLVGGRADPDQVREGAAAAVVEGEFALAGTRGERVDALLAEWGLTPEGGTVIVRREVQAGGKSRATVNQSAVTLTALKRLGEILLDLHGQHEHQSLLRPDAGLESLDRLGGLAEPRERWTEALARWREAKATLETLETSLATFADRRDGMLEAAREIDEVRPVEGEDESLRHEASRLQHVDRLRTLLTEALERLSDGDASAISSLAAAAQRVQHAAEIDPALGESLAPLEDARIAASEAARSLAEYAGALEADPRALEEIETRRERLARLTRKHHRDETELIRWREELERELAAAEDAGETLARARDAQVLSETACAAAGAELSRLRREAARVWSARLTRELKPLGLGSAKLDFSVEPLSPEPRNFLPHGVDQVALHFTANPGEPARPLRRIASGGELSRVMLALKAALEAQDRVDVLIFDEVDSGIGGGVAQAVGERLRLLAEHRQVICVTHLPMIAALATHHFRVSKHVAGGRTVVRMEPLEDEKRVDELARMLAGDLATATTRRQARELLAAPGPPAAAR